MTSRSRLLIFLGISALLVVLLFFSRYYSSSPGESSTERVVTTGQSPIPEKHVPGEIFVFREGNMLFRPATNWVRQDPTSIRMPEHVGVPFFTFVREGDACALSYIKFPMDFRDYYRQASFATRIFTETGLQLDGNWYVNMQASPHLTFSEVRQPTRAEIRMHAYPLSDYDSRRNYFHAFMLFAVDGGPVLDVCDSEFNEMLRSLEPSYETTDARNTNGSIYLKMIYGDTKERDRTTYLLSLFEGATVSKKIMTLASGYHVGYFKNRLYDTHDMRIWVIDPFTKTESPIPGTFQAGDEFKNDYYISGDELYYLSGRACDGPGDCDLRLFKIPLSGGEATLLKEHVPSRQILGFSGDKRMLYLRGGYGDAGCFNSDIYQFDMHTRELQIIDSFAGCSGESSDEQDFTKAEEYQARFYTYREYLGIERGALAIPSPGGMLDVKSSLLIRVFPEH